MTFNDHMNRWRGGALVSASLFLGGSFEGAAAW